MNHVSTSDSTSLSQDVLSVIHRHGAQRERGEVRRAVRVVRVVVVLVLVLAAAHKGNEIMEHRVEGTRSRFNLARRE